MMDLNTSYAPSHKPSKSNGISSSNKGMNIMQNYIANTTSGASKKQNKRISGENKYPKDNFMYKERSYEALMHNNWNNKGVNISNIQSVFTKKSRDNK